GVVGWSIGNGWCTLLVPVMFDHIKENALYIFGAANILAIVVVYLYYPETANVSLFSLPQIDFLFMSDLPFVWNAEAEHARLKGELDAIVKAKTGTEHKERFSDEA
ncbi:hypothetical protein JCM8547_007545, partial [Rhodosporidiobolus lusitaniae]